MMPEQLTNGWTTSYDRLMLENKMLRAGNDELSKRLIAATVREAKAKQKVRELIDLFEEGKP